MKTLLAAFLTLLSLPLFAGDPGIPYVIAPTNSPVDTYVVSRSGNKNKWVPYLSSTNAITNMVMRPGAGITIATNVVGVDYTVGSLWNTNSTDGSITNMNASNGGIVSVADSASVISVDNLGGAAGFYQGRTNGQTLFGVAGNGDITRIKNVQYLWPATNSADGQYLRRKSPGGQLFWGDPVAGVAAGTNIVLTTNGTTITVNVANTNLPVVSAGTNVTVTTNGLNYTVSSSDSMWRSNAYSGGMTNTIWPVGVTNNLNILGGGIIFTNGFASGSGWWGLSQSGSGFNVTQDGNARFGFPTNTPVAGDVLIATNTFGQSAWGPASVAASDLWTNDLDGPYRILRPVDQTRMVESYSIGTNYRAAFFLLNDTNPATLYTVGTYLQNQGTNTGTGSLFHGNGNYGAVGESSGNNGVALIAGDGVGAAGLADSGFGLQYGVQGMATAQYNGQTNVGAAFSATSNGKTGTTNVGLYVETQAGTGDPAISQSAVILADTRSTTNPIVVGRSNGVPVFTVDNKGDLTRIKNVTYSWPATNASAGQGLASDGGSPQQLYWTNFGSGSGNIINIGNTVFVDAVNGNDATATRGRLDLPALTYTGAVAKAQSGDLIKFGPGVFRTLDDNFYITNTALAFRGDGVGKTVLTSVGSGNDSTIWLTNGIYLFQDLTISNEVHTSEAFRFPIRIFGGPVKANFKNVRIDCESDAFYCSGTNITLTVDGCYIATSFDAMVFQCGGASDLNVFNSTFICTNRGLFPGEGNVQRNLQFFSDGTANIVGNTLLIQNSPTNSMNLLVRSNGVVNLSGNVMSCETNRTVMVLGETPTITFYGMTVNPETILGSYTVKGATVIQPGANVTVTTNNALNFTIASTGGGGGVGPGTPLRHAMFNSTTTNVTDSILFQPATNQLEMRMTNASFSAVQTNLIYGAYTNATGWRATEISVDPEGYTRIQQLLGSAVNPATFNRSGLRLNEAWMINGYGATQAGDGGGKTPDLLPIGDDVHSVGSSSSKVRYFYAGTLGYQFPDGGTISAAAYKQVFNTGGIYWYVNAGPNQVLSLVGNGTLNLGNSLLAAAAGQNDNYDTYLSRGFQGGAWQFGTNNSSGTAQPTVYLHGGKANGTDKPGDKIYLASGPSTGTGTPGAVGIATAEAATSTGSAANTSYYARYYVSPKVITLTTNADTLVFNFTIPTALRSAGGIVHVHTEIRDATDIASIDEQFAISAVRKGATVTCTNSVSGPISGLATGSAGMTTTWTVVANAQSVDVKCKVVTTGINATTAETRGTFFLNSSAVPLITW